LQITPGQISRRIIQLSPFSRYALAVALGVVAVAIRLALDPVWGTALPYITLFPAIMVSAWFGGLWPGVLTTLLTAVAAEYFFVDPAGSFAVLDKTELIGLVVFVGTGAFISVLNEAWRRGVNGLIESEERLGVTLHSIGDAVIVTDENGVITRMNAVAEALTGWQSAEALGRSLSEVLVIVNERTRAPAPNPVERALREGAIAGLANHTLLISRSGREIPIDDSAAPVRAEKGEVLGAVMVFRDITERRVIERERASSERVARELASIVESSDDAILGMDLDGTITAWNRAAEAMYGYTAEEAIGQPIRLLIPEDHREEDSAVLRRIRAGERVEHFETVRCRKDGTEVHVSLTVSPVHDAAGAVIGASKIARDITARRQLDEERASLLEREHAARLEIEHASRLKDEFLATVSHELRTPLNAVIGYAELLSAGAIPPQRVQATIDAIQRNAESQVRLVESLIDLSRILAGKLELDLAPLNVATIVERALEAVRPAADEKGVSISLVFPPKPVVVVGDAVRLRQVCWNLLSNALKFTDAGGRVTIAWRAENSYARLEVTDDGQGISREFLPHVFERFRQEGGARRSRAGLGLGLALVSEIVQAHGGTVSARSEGEGRGSTFTVTLPLASAAPVEDQVTSTEAPGATFAPGNRGSHSG
jgi:PAS domain S-box-containing protein